ncbi:hypothetical protein [Spiroplasma endosymbiont of Aleiodes alternator]
MNTFLKVFLTQRLQFCVYFILDVYFCNLTKNKPISFFAFLTSCILSL